jgi:hypothetical protein
MVSINLFIIAITNYVDHIKYSKIIKDEKMNNTKKFKEIYDKFNGNYGDLIIEHLRVLKELEKCHKLIRQQTTKGEEKR